MAASVGQPLVPLQSDGGGGVVGIVFLLVAVAVGLAVIAGTWKAFQKAGQPGWAAIIPIYNLYVMLKIGDNEWWWLLVILFVPIVNLYGLYKAFAGVAKAFGQGVGFSLGLWFLSFIFWPLLGFGDYQYQGTPA
jgi:ABC-type Na+ efflux pump permease subunit